MDEGTTKIREKPNAKNEVLVADGLIRDSNNQEWLILTEKQMTFLPVAVSDAMRFVVLHIYGGSYYDMDVVMLRDMRPLLIADEHAFAERWGGHSSPGDYNTAVMSLTANSSLSSYLLRGGVRMGLNFHPRIIGVMAVKDRRNQEFNMLETAAFDPIWTEFNWDRLGRCTVPCIKDYGQVFKGKNAFPNHDEWESYDGPQLKLASKPKSKHFWEVRSVEEAEVEKREISAERTTGKGIETLTLDRAALSKAEYKLEEDKYPPTNRTLEHFFRALGRIIFTTSGIKILNRHHGLMLFKEHKMVFFSGSRTNPYGEKWQGLELPPYENILGICINYRTCISSSQISARSSLH
ncbi:hypothetical protein DID88_007843 [Monilinia fructigena]|uniref:Nucleotide-diphospho-sugar transferase domain-containing protein n=1 Tax=Monilinia fructigena TaxID=38457 RepID=A0A395J5W2_9HELO|nr:hypothetical protein DID88_007843 [Monilinia fructigena]